MMEKFEKIRRLRELNRKIEEEKRRRYKAIVTDIQHEWVYTLCRAPDCRHAAGKQTLVLNFEFFHLENTPAVGDVIYLSENIFEGMRENLFTYYFSDQIGEIYARPPHDFLIVPEEFLIVEYADGTTVLLEQWYG